MAPVEFPTMESIREYLGGYKVECLICRHHFKSVGSHVRMAHGLSANQYKLTFGLPLGVGIVGRTTHALLSSHALEVVAEIGSAQTKINLEKGRATRRYGGDGIHGSPALLNLRRGVIDKIRPFRKSIGPGKDTPTEFPCSQCGALFNSSRAAVVLHGRRLLCKRCKYKSHKASQDKWLLSKGIDPKQWRAEMSRKSKLKRQLEQVATNNLR